VAALVFTTEGEDEWLKARFFMQHDILKDTWVFQEIRKEGREEGLGEGKKEEFIQFVEIRFPPLLAQARQAMEQKLSVQQLRVMLNALYRANTIEEAQAVLLANG
jgi:hypothetical protein